MSGLTGWPIPGPLFTAAQVQQLDRCAIDEHGIPGIVLMKRAGTALFDAINRRWPAVRSLTLVCGKGNNAGDGYVIAGLALDRGFQVQLVHLGDPDQLSGDAARARDWALARGLTIESLDVEQPVLHCRGELLVDALLGTGVKGTVRPGFARLIEQINALAADGLPVLAVDLPSGLCPDRGTPLGTAVRASRTLTLIGAKRGLVTGAGRDHVGALEFHDLQVPEAVLQSQTGLPALNWSQLYGLLPQRRPNAHKGDSGHALLVGGDLGMGGAICLAAQAALRVGPGLVSVLTRPAHSGVVLTRAPEVMALGSDAPAQDLPALLERATTVAVGPGLGRSAWSREALQLVLDGLGGRPLVLDADALNLLADNALQLPELAPGQLLLTPHPGEAARLLSCSAAEVQQDRFAAAAALAARWQALVVLKGAGSVLAAPPEAAALKLLPGIDAATQADGCIGVCLDGNPAMASGGMGDLLTGICAGLLAQPLAAADALALAVCLHGAAGDAAARRRGPRGLSAAQLLDELQPLLNGRTAAAGDQTAGKGQP